MGHSLLRQWARIGPRRRCRHRLRQRRDELLCEGVRRGAFVDRGREGRGQGEAQLGHERERRAIRVDVAALVAHDVRVVLRRRRRRWRGGSKTGDVT